MANDIVETIVGAGVIVVAVGFFYYASDSVTGISASGQYQISASFRDGSGISAGSDVRLSGVKIGSVTDLWLDKKNYNAIAGIAIDNGVQLPEDSSARIASEGLLGGSFISITPGGSSDMLLAGDEIEYTQGSVSLIDLIGKAIYGDGS